MTKQWQQLTAPAARRIPVDGNFALSQPLKRTGFYASVSTIGAKS